MATSSLRRNFIMDTNEQVERFLKAYEECVNLPKRESSVKLHELKGKRLTNFLKKVKARYEK